MLRWKQLVGATVVPLVVYAYSPVKEHVLEHYATRWDQQLDLRTRSVRIRIHNVSSAGALPVTVRLQSPGSKIADFEYADPWDGPPISYLSTARHSETLQRFDASLKRPIMLDEHLASFSLQDIEDELEAAAVDRSIPVKHRRPYLVEEMTLPNHLLWLEECRVSSPSAHPCCMERAWEMWEYMLRGIQGDQVALWKQLAGVQLDFSDFHLMPHGDTDFVLALPSGHSVLLQVEYGPDPVTGKIEVVNNDGPLMQVKDGLDLDRATALLFFTYPQFEDIYGALIALLALLTLPLWVPLKFLSTHTLVNRALSKTDQMTTAGEWDEVHGRIKFCLKDKFDTYRTLLGKPTSDLSSDALFDYLRGYLRLSYRGGLGRFQNDQQLRSEMNRGMLGLANV
jgi:hypothetical protein